MDSVTVQVAQWGIAGSFTLAAFLVVMIYSGRQGRTSIAKSVMEAIGNTDRRSFYSGNFGSDAALRTKIRKRIRNYVFPMFGGLMLALARCVAAAVALFVLAIFARATHEALAGQIGFGGLREDILRLALALLDSLTFNLFIALGLESSLLSKSASLNVISFSFMAAMALTFAAGIVAFFNNALTMLATVFLPWSLFRAADPGVDLEDNTILEKLIHLTLDFPDIEWDET
jgi:hypothetical protein